ncbi:MAG: methyltransferase domain-containing protein [Flavobacteriales bacterium]|nr:methyltransferase domain-containing protein [Flavobacteriales bacterium]
MQDIFDWDVQTWGNSLKIWSPAVENKHEMKCLEVGANKGGLSLWLAMHGHQVVCTDLEDPSERARPIHEEYQVGHLIEYRSLDILNPGDIGSFDVVIFKSILGGIGREGQEHLKEETIRSIFGLLKPGGYLLFAENQEGSFFHRLARRWLVKWGRSWSYLKPGEIQGLLHDFDSIEIQHTGFLSAFARGKLLRWVFGLKDKVFFNPLLPDRMKYVVFGSAQKPQQHTS